MDAEQHARFLSYLERWEYFRRPGMIKLDRDAFAAQDTELTQLLRANRPGRNPPPAATQARITHLRRTLLRD